MCSKGGRRAPAGGGDPAHPAGAAAWLVGALQVKQAQWLARRGGLVHVHQCQRLSCLPACVRSPGARFRNEEVVGIVRDKHGTEAAAVMAGMLIASSKTEQGVSSAAAVCWTATPLRCNAGGRPAFLARAWCSCVDAAALERGRCSWPADLQPARARMAVARCVPPCLAHSSGAHWAHHRPVRARHCWGHTPAQPRRAHHSLEHFGGAQVGSGHAAAEPAAPSRLRCCAGLLRQPACRASAHAQSGWPRAAARCPQGAGGGRAAAGGVCGARARRRAVPRGRGRRAATRAPPAAAVLHTVGGRVGGGAGLRCDTGGRSPLGAHSFGGKRAAAGSPCLPVCPEAMCSGTGWHSRTGACQGHRTASPTRAALSRAAAGTSLGPTACASGARC